MSFDIKEECGIFGISLASPDPAIINDLYLGLFALQHRGQESCGIAYKNKGPIQVLKRQGLVSGSFFEGLPHGHSADIGLGHVRYSTCGESNLMNAQPFVFNCNKGEIAIAHNGNIPKAMKIKEDLIKSGSIFQTTSDSEVLVHMIARSSDRDFETSLVEALGKIRGAYSMLLIHEDELIAFRDPYGFRPLCYGRVKGGYVFASETNALDLLGAEYEADVKPGEIVFCKKGSIRKRSFSENGKITQCIFELIYFSRPDSMVFGESVHGVRIQMGRMLASQRKKDHDVVIAVPDSGNSAALGFSRESGSPFEFGLIRNHYTGRTFIKPGQSKRIESVKIKLNPVKDIIKGRSVAVIDDSLVRGTTSSKIVKMLKDAGAKEVHLYLSSPGIKYGCFYGIDTPTREELISAKKTPAEIAGDIGADSVTFLNIEKMKECVKDPHKYCYACFNGDYPLSIDPEDKMCTI